MNNRSFFWEIKDILTQFCCAFDDAVIKRYDGNRDAKELISLRYVVAPKQRVIYDIVNKNQNLTLPVMAINITGINRDPSRVFNKIEPFYLPSKKTIGGTSTLSKVLAPTPINIEVSVSILTKYMTDMDQIISNFVPYSNPYIILSWAVPKEFNLASTTEIRSEVLWSGSLNYNTPTDISFTDKYRVSVDTSFTIKTWLFKEVVDPVGIIYKIDSNFYALSNIDILYSSDDYSKLSSFTDIITVSGAPSFTNLFYSSDRGTIPVFNDVYIRKSSPSIFIAYGRSFNYNNSFYLSSNTPNFFTNYTEIITSENTGISGYNIDKYVSVLNNNIFTINLSANTLSTAGTFTIVTANSAGWKSTDGYVNVID